MFVVLVILLRTYVLFSYVYTRESSSVGMM